jgi:hypothetical protein
VVVNEAGPLSETEVRDLILTFWRLNAEKAPVSEFAPIIDEGFALVAVNASAPPTLATGSDGAGAHPVPPQKRGQIDSWTRKSSADSWRRCHGLSFLSRST